MTEQTEERKLFIEEMIRDLEQRTDMSPAMKKELLYKFRRHKAAMFEGDVDALIELSIEAGLYEEPQD